MAAKKKKAKRKSHRRSGGASTCKVFKLGRIRRQVCFSKTGRVLSNLKWSKAVAKRVAKQKAPTMAERVDAALRRDEDNEMSRFSGLGSTRKKRRKSRRK